ncbi:ParB/RepB/Spo0J family partition protein [Sphingopyxis indica]|uniref:Chromosome partitioning protein, ParB family n=1 Tax=Sphingopyxis indica TaxID=436663 RepID=A0A239IXN0_9SPHN|nr:ParB/RepB/Spo0J family partition protein [Sphingopyxis indica]SNS97164.1 chromosome partitioning protein, ParB family [Sphingopyxis indica]
MTKSVKTIALSPSRDIPFDRLVLSQANVRHVKAGVSIEELAEDIARRTLLASITVRAVTDAEGKETGMFEVPAGGRRYRALELLVKQKRLPKTAPVPCVVREGGYAEEDSLAENIQRAPLHPLDQFRAFQALREKGMSEEEIAAAFFVSANVVKQRLKLASVGEALLDAFAEDEMTLDQLMAFTVNPDHERQAQVWEAVRGSYNDQPYQIRRMLTEHSVRASDKRALFVGIDAYVEAGGAVMRDLFESDDGGWLEDVGLVEMLVTEKLKEEAEAIRVEGWKWIEVGVDFPYGHTYGLRSISGEQSELTDEEQATRDALQAELDQLEAEYADAPELPDEIDERLGEIETAIDAINDRPVRYDEDDIARAGVFVSVDHGGRLRVDRGYVRPEDEEKVEPEYDGGINPASRPTTATSGTSDAGHTVDGDEEDDGLRPIPDRLVTELTAHRTVALRLAVGGSYGTAFCACLHALALKLFYSYAPDSCLELDAKCVFFGSQAPGLGETPYAEALTERHEAFAGALPDDSEQLWDAILAMPVKLRNALFAHCVAMTVNAAVEAYNRRPRALAHAERLATDIGLDMVDAGWTTTAENYLGKVTKARIVAAVREAKGDEAAEAIEGLKKDAQAERAEELIAGTGWLPEPLRTASVAAGSNDADEETADEADSEAQSAEDDGARSVADVEPLGDDEAVEGDPPYAVAAE